MASGDVRPHRRSSRPWPRIAVACLALAGAPGAGAQAPAAGDARLQVFAWLPMGAENDAAMLQALVDLGITGVAVGDGQDPAAARRAGLAVYRDQLVGKGTLELREEQFAAHRDAYERERATAHLQRPNCLSDPAVRGALLARALGAAQPLAAAPPSFVVLGDEVSTTRHTSPLDFSFSRHALAEFRAWLRARYHGVEGLNRAWQTSFADFEEVEPFTADRIRARELSSRGELPRNLAPWSDHRSFMDRTLARTVRALAGSVRTTLAVPCGLTGVQAPAAYGGTDYAELLPELDLYEVYDVGGARDLAMSFARPHARQITTLVPLRADEPREILAARISDALAHGMAGLVIWHAGHLLARDGDVIEPTAFAGALRAALAANRDAVCLAGATIERSPVWIVESHAAVQAHWMLDSSADGDTWLRRLASYEEKHSTSLAARASWVRLCEDLGLQPTFVAAGDLAGRLQKQSPRLVVLAACVALGDDAAHAIASYVERGGVAVADGMLAFYDEGLHRRARPGLDALFGLDRRGVPDFADLLVHEGLPATQARLPSGAAASERHVRASVCERVGQGVSVQCEHAVGRGTAVYLNLAVCEYARVRLDPGRLLTARDLRRRVQRVLDVAEVAPPVLVRGEGLPTCIERTLLRGDGGRRFLAVRVNANERPDILRALARRPSIQVTLDMAQPCRLQVLGEGTPRDESTRFDVALDPWRGLFAEIASR